MPLLPNDNPDGTLVSGIRLTSTGVPIPETAGVRFGEPIPGPEGPVGPTGPSMLPLSIPGVLVIRSVGRDDR